MPVSVRIRNALWQLTRSVILLAALAVIGLALLCGLIVLQGRRDDVVTNVRVVDALLVMGAAQWDGHPSPVFEARLSHALDLYRRGVAPRIILTGGVAPGDRYSEAAVAKDFMLQQGVPEQALLIEETSRTSWQNLQASAAIAREQGIVSVLIVSDDFHMLRSLKMAHDLGMRAYGSPARNSPIADNIRVEGRYVLREAGAYVVYLFLQR
jgi:uncharacterized SAM-binding protein YcdF (DUF218 family)